MCAFGRAHVDSPKGDVNADGRVSNADVIVGDNSFVYPYGTSEQFPSMRDSNLQVLTNTAHDYMECSNKGECDRKTGGCVCYDGYDGSSCQRASCPGYPSMCSGHGVCRSISQLAMLDNDNVYMLWDKNMTMGCACDAGFYGPDCSQKSCKYGLDPLYLDDATTVKVATFEFAVLATTTTAITTSTVPSVSKADGSNADFFDFWSQSNPGKFAIRFYDNKGKAWLTSPIEAGSSCALVSAALESLPNNVVPKDSVRCTQSVGNNKDETVGWTTLSLYDAQHATGVHAYKLTYQMAFWEAFSSVLSTDITVDNSAGLNVANPADPNAFLTAGTYAYTYGTSTSTGKTSSKTLSGSIYRLKFTGNPGVFKQPELETYLDGNTRPSLKSKGGTVITKVWTDGQQGEFSDYHADHCDGVSATLALSITQTAFTSEELRTAYSYLTGLTSAEANLLKACLGDADGDMTNNVDVYNWDYGNTQTPHLIKLVRTVTGYLDGGFYAAIWYDAGLNRFRLINPFLPPDLLLTDQYEIYTTTGTFAKASAAHKAIFNFGSPYVITMNLAADTTWPTAGGSLSADTGDLSCTSSPNAVCLNKGDLFTVLSATNTGFNPPRINLYTANKISTNAAVNDVGVLLAAGTHNLDWPNGRYAAAKALTNVIYTDLSVNWGNSFDSQSAFSIYKFTPSTASTYNYVAECSNRGVCNRVSGTCSCFSGYTNDACSEQNSLAL